MAHIEQEGKIYCDWRITTSGCEASNFFRIAYIYAAACFLYAICGFSASFFTRKFLVGDSWKSFQRGENLVLIFLLFTNFVYLAHILCVLLDAEEPVPGILWSFTTPPRFITVLYTHDILVRAVPQSAFGSQSSSSFSIGENARKALLIFVSLLFTLSNVILISVGHVFMARGSLLIGSILERVGLTISAAIMLIITVSFFVSLYTLKRKLEAVILQGKEVKKGQIDNSLLVISLQKVNQSLYASTFIDVIETVYMLLLAHFQGFFTLLPFSKAFISIMFIIYPTLSVFFSSFQVIVDTKKAIYVRQVKKNSSKESKKDDVTLDSAPHISLNGKEDVEQIINELKPKESS